MNVNDMRFMNYELYELNSTSAVKFMNIGVYFKDSWPATSSIFAPSHASVCTKAVVKSIKTIGCKGPIRPCKIRQWCTLTL
jgi:hypothetical protein